MSNLRRTVTGPNEGTLRQTREYRAAQREGNLERMQQISMDILRGGQARGTAAAARAARQRGTAQG